MGDKLVVLHSLIVIPVFKYSTNSGRTANPATSKKGWANEYMYIVSILVSSLFLKTLQYSLNKSTLQKQSKLYIRYTFWETEDHVGSWKVNNHAECKQMGF